ncbi:MAG TPA: exodeoxyribonuclease VII small subunit [Gammaproteobacteria bacterium]|nr:exodeoxyribonuclease VII small subunit [Gammaproteobacteria bacterium]
MPKRTATKATPASGPDFEQSLAELEKLVSRLEKGDLGLEDSLKEFERGIELTRYCQSALKEAELRVKKLVTRNGVTTQEPFDLDNK